MATASQLFADRDTKGAAYATALANLKTAWIDLRALDLACGTPRVLSLHPSGAWKHPVYGFTVHSYEDLLDLWHPLYGTKESMALWNKSATTAADTHVNNATAG